MHLQKREANDVPALSVIDLAMFLLETPERPFNIGPLIVLDPPPRGRDTFADRLSARMLKRPLGPPFNYRLHTPLIGVPSLEADPNTNPTGHLHHLTLPVPGSFEQLFATVCELHGARLDRSRLLWDLWVIDGLEDGKVALYGKAQAAEPPPGLWHRSTERLLSGFRLANG